MVSQICEATLDRIADSLVVNGYVIATDIVPDDVSRLLREKVINTRDSDFKKAAIGRGNEQQVNADIRSDKISWLAASDPVDEAYLTLMTQLREGLNRRLFMGLFDYESHYAVYEAGAFYKKHVDALKGTQNRILTTVFFLNPDWQPEHGGVLAIYEEDDSLLELVAPKMGTMVIFLSERFPHEVQTSFATRASIAGWFRVSNSVYGF